MNDPEGALLNLTARTYDRMLRWYPPRFRREFAGELREVFLDRLSEPGDQVWFAMREFSGLARSILRERWHERRARKGEEMETEHELSGGGSGVAVLRSAGVPRRVVWWIMRWILSALLVLPLALFASYPLSLPFMAIIDLGTRLNLWPAPAEMAWLTLGFTTSLGLLAAWVQWRLLQRYLPGAGRWFWATALGFGLGGVIAAAFGVADILGMEDRFARFALAFLAIGLLLGLCHWLFLRRSLRLAAWLIPVDLLAVASLLPIRMPMDWTFLLILMPGVVSGVGTWIILQREVAIHPQVAQTPPARQVIPWSRRLVRTGIALAVVAVLFFGGAWINASAMLLNAKASGTFPTLEEAITQHASQGWEEQGAKILSISVENVSPAVVNGVRQHVRWGCANIRLDRIPARHRNSGFPICTQYVHTRDGWVLMGEGFSPFVAWAMELFNMENLREFQAENSK